MHFGQHTWYNFAMRTRLLSGGTWVCGKTIVPEGLTGPQLSFNFTVRFLGIGEIGMEKSAEEVKTYFVTIPAHKFLHIKNYESNGYWDFWQKQNAIPGQDCDTICGLLDSIKGKLDDKGSSESNGGSGQIMAYIHDPKGHRY